MTIMKKAAVILGVMISPAAIAQQSADPTFAENVAPIIYENCGFSVIGLDRSRL
ncbi:MAG: hypothetical protein CM1200mP40_05600 [Gammaproteobacteria bacterium]|nr:MAG: hypothetical protein CM1200mP40_05600 [Gammaproteobacteria bacterium]